MGQKDFSQRQFAKVYVMRICASEDLYPESFFFFFSFDSLMGEIPVAHDNLTANYLKQK